MIPLSWNNTSQVLGAHELQSHPKAFETLKVEPLIAKFLNNTYEDISMGVTRLRNNDTYVRGSLHKAYNVMALDFSGEKYYNIMGHTSEHLQQVIMQVKG